ncbi:hypothetical protein FLLO111716_14070 [Flavobacterium longum]|uniref:C1 family peptidase n=1 Tax=Flavobacterium longum TaxID=1299340 RepID=UPI0039EA67E1
MRYIYLKPVRNAEDKQRVANHPKMSKANLEKLIKDKTETKIITEQTKETAKKRNETVRNLIWEESSKALVGKKHALSELVSGKIKPLPSAPKFKDGDDLFFLNDVESLATDALYVRKMNENKANDFKLYQELRAEIAPLIKDAPAKLQKLFSSLPDSPNILSVALRKDLLKLAKIGLELPSVTLVRQYDLNNPGPEQGEGNKSDQHLSNSCRRSNPAPNAKGFVANVNWPLKPHLTSVKNQGRRGTCTAFGTVAAVESAISVRYGRKVNLSEQDLYKKQKLDWNPNIFDDYYGDGYFPPMSALFQMVSGYVFPFESSWEYNPSLSRVENDATRRYTHSCDNYSGDCSNTNHQADRDCYVMDITDTKKVVREVCDWFEGIPILGVLAGWVCHTVTDWVTEVIDQVEVCVFDTNVRGTSRFKLTNFSLIWDPIWQSDITLAKWCLSRRRPIIFCFSVAPSFRTGNHSATDGKGFVVFDEKEKLPADAGGHCVELVGYVDNDQIPASLNIAKGAGGGYFIVKNSWGKCFGDVGYAYLPYAWVDKWGTSMVALTGVQRV